MHKVRIAKSLVIDANICIAICKFVRSNAKSNHRNKTQVYCEAKRHRYCCCCCCLPKTFAIYVWFSFDSSRKQMQSDGCIRYIVFQIMVKSN